jgi:hypothetical protein
LVIVVEARVEVPVTVKRVAVVVARVEVPVAKRPAVKRLRAEIALDDEALARVVLPVTLSVPPKIPLPDAEIFVVEALARVV